MLIKRIFPLFLLIPICHSFAQEKASDISKIIERINEPHLFGEVVYYQKQTIGDQLYLKSWTAGSIRLKDGRMSNDKLLNYNGYLDELMLFNSVTLKTVILDKRAIHEFILLDSRTNESLLFRNIKANTPYSIRPAEIFVQVLHEGNYSIYAYRQVVQSGKDIQRHNNILIETPEVKAKTLYYLRLPNGTYSNFHKLRRWSLKSILPNEKEAARKIISENRLRLRREADIVKLIKLLNEHN